MPISEATNNADVEHARHRVMRVRQEVRRRRLTVLATERVTPAMVRITFSGPDLADFSSLGHDDHVKLFIPGPTPEHEPARRDYTPRRFDTGRRQLVIDFVLHDAGPATGWAKSAAIGDTLEIGGPRGSTIVPDDFDWLLLVGDETALPAIGRRLEELRPGTSVTTVMVVNDASEAQEIDTAADWHPHWAYRSSEGHDDAATLLRIVSGLPLPDGDGFVWVAAEAQAARAVRRHMLDVRRHPLGWLKASGYWVRGQAGAHAKLSAEELPGGAAPA